MTDVALNIGPIFPNGGKYGYCWLCVACEISEYFGGSGVTLSSAHSVAHGTSHTLYNCPSGNRDDVNTVVDYYTGKTGTKTGALSAYQTVLAIGNNDPVCSVWKHGSAGHYMLIAGYSYDPNNYDFSFIIHDPNYTVPVYLYCSYYAISFSYQINSDYYTWTYSLYNWT